MALSACEVMIDKERKELAEHGLAMFPIACYADDLTRIAVPWHWHNEFEFILMTAGQAHVQIENRSLLLRQGDAVFINSDVLHMLEYEKQPEARFHSLVFHARLIGGSMDSVFWKKLIAPVIPDKSFRYLYLKQETPWQNEMTAHMAAAWQAIAQETEDFENEARYHLSKAFWLMNGNRPVTGAAMSRRDQLSAERIKIMIQYIEEHYSEEITLAMIAASALVSKSVCLRCFHQVIGSTPIRYLMQYRIEQAAERLKQTDEKSNEIAMACGFSDISYFSKCFREQKGFAPLQYRRAFGERS